MDFKKFLPESFKDFIKSKISSDGDASFLSQSGEDMMLRNLFWRDFFEKNKSGFYIDIGAYHPTRFSNTHFFYQQGWRGINIDGCKESILLFEKDRIHDTNVHAVVSDVESDVFFPDKMGSMNSISNTKEGCVTMKSVKLATLLDQHLPKDQRINFMSIDVEGHDLEILKSNNWDKYRPMVILIEIEGKTVQETLKSDVLQYLELLNYKCVARSYIVSHVGTSIFVDNNTSLP